MGISWSGSRTLVWRSTSRLWRPSVCEWQDLPVPHRSSSRSIDRGLRLLCCRMVPHLEVSYRLARDGPSQG